VRDEKRRITVAPGVRRLRATGQTHPVVGILCGLALAAGCSQGPSVHGLADSGRVVEDARIDFEKTSSAAERFGLRTRREPKAPMAAEEPASGMAWTAPAGWVELPSTSMRSANFRPAGDEQAECYLTLLAGDGGGLAANINRWRTQLALPGMSAREIEELPHSPMFGRDAVLVDFVGTWKGMSGSESREQWRLVGLLLVEPGGSAFLKMTGPDAVVAAERDAFRMLAGSFRPAGGAHDPHAGHDHGPDDGHDHPHDFPPASDAPPAGGSAANDTAAGFTFTTPQGWRRAPDRPARAFTLFAGQGEELECYVTTLAGEAGGALANVNRWRGQLGLASIGSAELASMPTVSMLGGEAVLVECDGTAASLLGASCNGPDGSVFVKMTGPRDLVRAQRAAFLAFCGSLSRGS